MLISFHPIHSHPVICEKCNPKPQQKLTHTEVLVVLQQTSLVNTNINKSNVVDSIYSTSKEHNQCSNRKKNVQSPSAATMQTNKKYTPSYNGEINDYYFCFCCKNFNLNICLSYTQKLSMIYGSSDVKYFCYFVRDLEKFSDRNSPHRLVTVKLFLNKHRLAAQILMSLPIELNKSFAIELFDVVYHFLKKCKQFLKQTCRRQNEASTIKYTPNATHCFRIV